MNECFGFFREHKIQKVPFSLQERLSFTWDFKTFPGNSIQ